MEIFKGYDTPEELIMLADFANQMDQQEDVLYFLKKLVQKNPHLDTKGRNLFASASKYVIGRARHSLRILAWYMRNDLTESLREITEEYYRKLGEELIVACKNVLEILEEYLIPHATELSTKVFYCKLKGDYYRYITEFDLNEKRDQAIEDAGNAYREGMDLAEKGLKPEDYHRLGLALSYSVYFYEVCNATDQACELAQKTLEEGEEGLKRLADEDRASEQKSEDECSSRKDHDAEECAGVLQLMKENLSIWKHEKDC